MEHWTFTMPDKDLRKALGGRLKALRKAKGWSQKELAALIDVHFSLLNKYEGGLHVPPLEKLVLLAQHLDTTLDHLLTGEADDETSLRSPQLLERFKALQEFGPEDQSAVIRLIDALIVRRRVESALQQPTGG